MSSTARPEERIEVSEGLQATGTDGPVNLRETVVERLAMHRSRRAEVDAQVRAQEADLEAAARRRRELARGEQRRGISAVRDAVLARYEGTQSYREFLAAEAECALAQAQAEAEVAARKARAVAEAQLQLLEELEQWNVDEPGPREQAISAHRAGARSDLAHALADIALGARELLAEPPYLPVREFAPTPEAAAAAQVAGSERATPVTEVSAGGLTVKLYEDLGASRFGHERATPHRNSAPAGTSGSKDEMEALEHEIEFRRAPEFQDHVIETTPIPGNLIEFPRELIAPRRARPRLAEGPLREEAEAAAEPQLRIFEVEPEQVSHAPTVSEAHQAPEWQSLLLDASREPQPRTSQTAQAHFATELEAAPIELRLMAALVDCCLIAVGLLAFVTLAAYISGPAMRDVPLPVLLVSGLVTFALLALAYQMLFFTFAEGTPGMLFARIGLCTFGDRNPSRQAMRRRVLATVLAASPLGLGLLWMWMDGDRLGWHDRMSRMYQRAY